MPTDQKELKQLATEINAEHIAALGASRTALDHAQRAGDRLQQVKDRLKHGEWLSWLAANCDVAVTTAQEYMRVAKHWAQLEAYRNTRPAVHLDITKALRLIANDFVDHEQDPDDADVGPLAPGGV
jgi:hypothetical protein